MYRNFQELDHKLYNGAQLQPNPFKAFREVTDQRRWMDRQVRPRNQPCGHAAPWFGIDTLKV